MPKYPAGQYVMVNGEMRPARAILRTPGGITYQALYVAPARHSQER